MDFVRRVTMQRGKEKGWIKKLEEFRPGDTVKVHVKIKEGEKERVQVYRGVVIKTQGTGLGRSFTVRKISSGVGVERTFPYASPSVDRVEVVSRGNVRRSRLFFLRGLEGRAARLQSELVISEGDATTADAVAPEAAAAAAETKAPEAAAKKS